VVVVLVVSSLELVAVGVSPIVGIYVVNREAKPPYCNLGIICIFDYFIN